MLKQMLERLKNFNFRKFLKEAPNSFLNFPCKCLLNVINDNYPVIRQVLKNQVDSFQQLSSMETSLKKNRYMLARKSELIQALGFLCHLYLKVKY